MKSLLVVNNRLKGRLVFTSTLIAAGLWHVTELGWTSGRRKHRERNDKESTIRQTEMSEKKETSSDFPRGRSGATQSAHGPRPFRFLSSWKKYVFKLRGVHVGAGYRLVRGSLSNETESVAAAQ